VREIRMLRSTWRGLETESRSGLHGHERGNPGYRQDHGLTDHRASPRPYLVCAMQAETLVLRWPDSDRTPVDIPIG